MLLAMFIPNYIKYNKLKKQELAQRDLFKLYYAELIHFKDNGRFTASIPHLNVELSKDYKYEIIRTSSKTFIIRATGNIDKDKTLDVWEINEKGIVFSKSNDILE